MWTAVGCARSRNLADMGFGKLPSVRVDVSRVRQKVDLQRRVVTDMARINVGDLVADYYVHARFSPGKMTYEIEVEPYEISLWTRNGRAADWVKALGAECFDKRYEIFFAMPYTMRDLHSSKYHRLVWRNGHATMFI